MQHIDGYCTVKILMLLTNVNANVLKNNTGMLIIPLRYLSGPKTLLYNSFIFFRSLIRDFLFSFVFFRSLTGNFFFLLLFLKRVSSSTVSDSSFLGDPTIPFSEGKDGNSHPGSRFMVI